MLYKIKKYHQTLICLILASLTSSAFSEYQTNHFQRKAPPNFIEIPAGKERKTAFFNYLLPLINEANAKILFLRHQIIQNSKQPQQHQAWFQKVSKFYYHKNFDPTNPKNIEQLLKSVDIIPPSLALAQAANESGWGTSRFATNANNYFGQWCFKKGCGLVPKNRSSNSKHEVRAFNHPYDSIKAYIINLNRHRQYATLRQLRYLNRQSNTPINSLALATGLLHYSQRREAYVKELQLMIRYNKLQQFDI